MLRPSNLETPASTESSIDASAVLQSPSGEERALAPEEALATLLDQILDQLQAGKVVDQAGLLQLHPQLSSQLQLLFALHNNEATLPGTSPVGTLDLSQIGPYLIERQLGMGGFGVVYLAQDVDLKRRVALKVLHPARLVQTEVLRRFQREAAVTAQLRHPGIVQLFDFSRNGPPHYLVTEYVEGVDPCTWCRQQGSSPELGAELVARIAEVLDYAHREGVCHRDLKPANLLIDDNGLPHVLDFGLARLLHVSDEQTGATSEGRVLGSLAYMAPEQAAGASHHADARTDVYSLGVILYEILTGQPPFQGPAHSLPARVLEDDPTPPRRLNSAVSRELEAVCLKAMSKRPDHRYPSAAALACDLRACVSGGGGVQAQPRSWMTRVSHVLERRHRDTMPTGWTPLLLLLGVTILAGSVLSNAWELLLPPLPALWCILLTKSLQVGVMLLLAVRLRPLKETHLTAAERQIWTLFPAYYGGFLALILANHFLTNDIPLAPVLSVLSGMGFVSLGATIWGWFYIYGAAFFGLAILIAFFPAFGLSLVGVGWFVGLVVGCAHLHLTRTP